MIGRVSKKKVFDYRETLHAINKMREINPNLEVKINTVVNKLNFSENLSEFIQEVQPQKWKVFKLLPIYSDKLEIQDHEFYKFIETHAHLNKIMSTENNDDMTESYLMIDPIGRFFQNGIEQGYNYSSPLCEVSADTALRQINFDTNKFISRYKRII
jgi:radical S-adenosyl methionine domain-containing protein 2